MRVFSYKKYLEWCDLAGAPAREWAQECDQQPVLNGMIKSRKTGMSLLSDPKWECEA